MDLVTDVVRAYSVATKKAAQCNETEMENTLT